MNKFITIIASFALTLTLTGCDDDFIKKNKSESQEETQKLKVDIYAFTKKFDSKKEAITLNPAQEKTVDEIIVAYEAFLAETKIGNYPTINAYAKKHDWTVRYYDDESYSEYKAKINDGSNVSILFKYYNFPENMIKGHEIYAWRLNEKQCNYLVNYFKYHEKIATNVEKYSQNPSGTSSQSSSCKDLNKEDSGIAVHLKYTGETVDKEYPYINEHLMLLFNKQYEKVAQYENLYFTKEPVNYKAFRDGVGYAINTVNNHITAGALSKKGCKEITYNLSQTIQYKIIGSKECSNGLNTIEFYQ
jgi:hypothetical protein